MRKDQLIYQLSIADIQEVAEEMLDRTLNQFEVKKVINRVGDHIPWFDCIYNTFLELGIKSKDELLSNSSKRKKSRI